MCAGGMNHFTELFRVIQQGAGLKHVVVEGLTVVISHKERRSIRLKQCLFPDVGV